MIKKHFRSGETGPPETAPDGGGTPIVPATRSTLADQLTNLLQLLDNEGIEPKDFEQLDRLLQEGLQRPDDRRHPLEAQAELARLTGKYGYIAGQFPTAEPVHLATFRRGRRVGLFPGFGENSTPLSREDWAALIEQLAALRPRNVSDEASSFDQKLDAAGRLMQFEDVPYEGIRRLRAAMRASTPSKQYPLEIAIFEVATYCGYLVDYGPCHYGRPAAISKIKYHRQVPVSAWGSRIDNEGAPVIEYPLGHDVKFDLKAAILKAFPNLSEQEVGDYLAEGRRRNDAAGRALSYPQLTATKPDEPIQYRDRPPGMKLIEFLRTEYLAKGVLARPGFNRLSIKAIDEPLYDAIVDFTQKKDLPADVDIPKARQRVNKREAALHPRRRAPKIDKN